MKRLHVFRKGTHRTSAGQTLEFSEADVSQSAAVYDPKVCKAPLVIGHPKGGDAPAFGYAESFSAEKGEMYCTTARVPDEVVDWGEQGHITGVSASFYLPDSPSNPVPGSYYPRHIGLLGQQQPAIKGLDNWPNFAEEAEKEEHAELVLDFAEADFADASRNADLIGRMMRSIRDWLIDTQGADTADRVLPPFWVEDLEDEGREEDPSFSEEDTSPDEGGDADTPTDPTDPAMDPDDEDDTDTDTPTDEERQQALEEREAALDEREQSLDERETSIDEQKAEAQREEHSNFAEDLADDGARILPRHVDTVARTLDALDGAEETVDFSESGGEEETSVADAFRQFLKELPQNVDFSEVSAPGEGGGEVDTSDAAALAQEAVDFQEQRRQAGETISMSEAVQHVKNQRAS